MVFQLDESDAQSIRSAKEAFESSPVKTDLVFIKTNFSSIVAAIIKLETQGLKLSESIGIVETIHDGLKSPKKREFLYKMDAVFKRNRGYKSILEIRDVLENGTEPKDEYVRKLTAKQLAMFNYCPVTSTDVERSFSTYGTILTQNRRSFLFENLKQHMVIQCNRNKEDN